MKVTRTSAFSGERNTMDLDVTEEQLLQYFTGCGLIQDIFPHLSAEEREFLKTGVTPEEWNTFMGEEE